ncbi:peptidyl-tRNA hydrolase [Campylobacter blaseri]|uniref:Peptidyl-tRNA hydrolase n=1 Tax=Campylobacter blaseri TaxID=2042961 RepID=A0A2P8R160_9BACT|nr:aminoacyl-tRNA hydrolase [Campylobacter blaseri]PSM52229.1 aminoacyl-tRNA hydrolase [Campylobacter blaseri]PSM53995.1 aminoacyl-tRNA hydrolase [Campylobacter blaseri]QKF85433.1 peptidyl-tRNA hydrolase [Campylobacter blaseri]
MILVVGLGNIGKKYDLTRHNIGFMLIDKIIDDAYIDITSSKFQGELYKKGSLLLLKPHTFMNLSGNSVKAVKDFYKPERIIVVHDDLDLNYGAVRFKKGGSSGGHNGIKSIDGLIGNDYERVRLGIGKSSNSAIDHVLGKFNEDEKQYLEEFLTHSKKAVLELVKSDLATVRNSFTRKGI